MVTLRGGEFALALVAGGASLPGGPPGEQAFEPRAEVERETTRAKTRRDGTSGCCSVVQDHRAEATGGPGQAAAMMWLVTGPSVLDEHV